jgi:hypothetical protein
MAKKSKQQPKKVEAKKEVVEATAVSSKATSVQILTKVTEILKKEGATGYVIGVVGSDSKILPWVGASSIGDLLTIKYVVEKEISRLIDGTSSSAEASSSPAQQ